MTSLFLFTPWLIHQVFIEWLLSASEYSKCSDKMTKKEFFSPKRAYILMSEQKI